MDVSGAQGKVPSAVTLHGALRLITRLLPVLLEDEANGTGLLWTARPVQQESARDSGASAQQETPPRLHELIDRLMHLAFLPGFTLPQDRAAALASDTPSSPQSVHAQLFWETGVGKPGDALASPTSDLLLARTAVLRALLATLSGPLYRRGVDGEADLPGERSGVEYAISTACPFASTLFYSLLNTIVRTGAGLDAWALPAWSSDGGGGLLDLALQLLLVLVDAEPSPRTDDGDAPVNVYATCLSMVDREEEFALIFDALVLLLANQRRVLSSPLPYAGRRSGAFAESLILLWKMCNINEPFAAYMLASRDPAPLIVSLLYFLALYRNDESRKGLMHNIVFLLLLLSGNRDFGIALNEPLEEKLQLDLPNLAGGSLADLLVVTFHKVIVSGSLNMSSLYDCLLTILANVSPYIKTLIMVSSVKLLSLFEIFSSARFTYAAENNHRYVFFLLQIFNNMIQYQYSGNSNLVYSILQRKKCFEDLAAPPSDAEEAARLARLAARIREGTNAAPQQASAARVEQLTSATTTAADGTVVRKRGVGEADAVVDASDTAGPASSSRRGANVAESEAADDGDAFVDELQREHMAALAQERVVDDDVSLIASMSPTGFVPTNEWINSWKERLPLSVVFVVLDSLLPKIEVMFANSKTRDESKVLHYIQNSTMVGLLPVPHAILIRNYQSNRYTDMWLSTYLWGVIYVRNMSPPLFDGNAIRLFQVMPAAKPGSKGKDKAEKTAEVEKAAVEKDVEEAAVEKAEDAPTDEPVPEEKPEKKKEKREKKDKKDKKDKKESKKGKEKA